MKNVSIKIGVVGMGFVGNACIAGFEYGGFTVYSFDVDKSKNPTHDSLLSLVSESNVVFLCVPTPMNISTGECDYRIIEGIVAEIQSFNLSRLPILVIKSTIPPGTTDYLSKKYNLPLVFNPEFLTEANWFRDFITQDRVVISGTKEQFQELKFIYQEVFPVTSTPFFHLSNIEAELVKYISNSFLATKVAFFNEMYQICQKSGVTYESVRSAVTSDPRIGISHTMVPGLDGQFGYSGTCFPKDINAFIRYAKKIGLDPKLLEASWNKNLEVRPNKDWENLKGRAVSN